MKGGPIVNSTPTFEDSDDSDSSDEEKAIEKDLLNKSNDSGKEEESEEKDGEFEEAFETPEGSPKSSNAKHGYDYQRKTELAPKDINLNLSSENIIGDVDQRTTRRTNPSANLVTACPDPFTYHEAISEKRQVSGAMPLKPNYPS